MNNPWFRSSLVLLAALALTGCAGYKLGSMLPPEIQTVNVPTFSNKTKEPLIEGPCTQAVIEEFQKDGSLRVVRSDQSDAILTVAVTSFDLNPLGYRRDIQNAANQYRLIITASLIMERRSDHKILAQNPRVKGEAVFDLTGDLTSAKSRILPLAAKDLAHQIVEKVVEAW
jgi:hypothetical protein